MDRVALLDAISAGRATGSALADRFSVSRAMVWKAVEALRSEGLVITGVPGEGYRLTDAAGFGPTTLAWRCGRPVYYFDRCGSTNREARDRLADQPNESLLVVADAQDAGRGRRGRTWMSQPGENLLFSLVLRPAVVPQEAACCVLAWAAAIAEVLDVQVKWPNDLVTASGAKLGGILSELDAEGDEVRSVVLGVGINVNQQQFPGLPHATSLSVLRGVTIDRAALLGDLVSAIEAVDIASTPSLDRWRARSHTLGRRVRVGSITGVASAVRDDGALIVDGQPILAGDVELIT